MPRASTMSPWCGQRVLRRVPRAGRGHVEDRELPALVLHRHAAVARHVVGGHQRHPALRRPRRGRGSGAGLPPVRRPLLTALLDEAQRVVRPGRVREVAEALLALRVVHHLLPLAGVGVDEVLHLPLELLRDPEPILDHDLPQVRRCRPAAPRASARCA